MLLNIPWNWNLFKELLLGSIGALCENMEISKSVSFSPDSEKADTKAGWYWELGWCRKAIHGHKKNTKKKIGFLGKQILSEELLTKVFFCF